eukprot:Selendium_serpulae@DN5670_c0_g1_i1.p1
MEIVRTKKEDKIPIILIGDWLCSAVKAQAGEAEAKSMRAAALALFPSVTTDAEGEAPVDKVDLSKIFTLFLNYEKDVFELLRRAKNEEFVMWTNVANPDSISKKPYMEVYKETEEFFIVLISLIKRVEEEVPPPDENPSLQNMILDFHSKVGQLDDPEFVELRLRLLQVLYNALRPTFSYRFATFMCILKYAAAQKIFDQLMPYVDFIDSWIQDWRISSKQRKQLFLLLGTELKKINRQTESFNFLLRFLQEFQGCQDPKELNEPANAEAALTLALEAAKHRDVLYVDHMLRLNAIQNLTQNGNQLAVDLLKIYESGNKSDLESFFAKNADFCTKHSLDYDSCLAKLNIVCLAGCANQSSFTLASVSSNLDLSIEKSEELVAKAISEGVLDAKFDQVNQIVRVRSPMKRQFTNADWVDLQSKLAQWTDSTKHFLKELQDRRENAALS